MSKPSKSPNPANNSSSVGSVCPPTARSLSMMTAEPQTDPRQTPTALSNSVNTAIGGTPSDFKSSSGLSDTSARSGRVTSDKSTPKTAKAPTSPEIIMNDLRRGSLFGRQTKNVAQSEPESMTNITWTNTGDLSTPSQMSSFDGKPPNNHFSINTEMSVSIRTGIPVTEKSVLSGAPKTRNRSPVAQIDALKKREEQRKQLDAMSPNPNVSTKSKKSKKSKKSVKGLDASTISMKTGFSKKLKKSKKSKKSSKKEEPITVNLDYAKRSKKSKKSKKDEVPPMSGRAGIIKKKLDECTPLPGVMQTIPPSPPGKNFVMKPEVPADSSSKIQKIKSSQVNNFPGAGKYTRNMDEVAPKTPQNATDPNQSHVVYDVSKLNSNQRRCRPKKPIKCIGRFSPSRTRPGTKKSTGRSASRRVADPPSEKTIGNNQIVVLGTTQDGKNTIRMTIDMQIVSGEALGGSDKPMTIVPKKVMVGGKELPVDSSEEKSEN
ncbi:hypothetical protein GCK72_009325 [Caenorhabditis remanei]|uniref:Uncharacterized protein n=1 Tax=Caenorhabditis remanei TaxID=31234 RepID=A0A6A5H228_CAERE|nr:hypothetical protein GCK72_009325 [Caenorhabditis remanei]KAF1761071.1 hypothetical protein GCK72_009325 [Caenorhabditis remanei]